MTTVVEYFTRHYSLVIDNDQSMHNASVRGARSVLVESGVSLAEYLAMDDKQRAARFAEQIGEKIFNMVEALTMEAVADLDHPGSLLIREIMIFSSSDLGWSLGKHYMPEDSEVLEYLVDDDEDES